VFGRQAKAAQLCEPGQRMNPRRVPSRLRTDMRFEHLLQCQVDEEQAMAQLPNAHKMRADTPVGLRASAPMLHLFPNVHDNEFSRTTRVLPATAWRGRGWREYGELDAARRPGRRRQPRPAGVCGPAEGGWRLVRRDCTTCRCSRRGAGGRGGCASRSGSARRASGPSRASDSRSHPRRAPAAPAEGKAGRSS